jgi:hypothetical protein
MNMKMNVTSKVQLDERLLDEIRNQVRETLAIEVKEEKTDRIFCVADLWNIRKQRKQRISRRSF